jgi:DNA-binding IclR family transcriptional regulator
MSMSPTIMSPALEARRRRLRSLIRWLRERQKNSVPTTEEDALNYLAMNFALRKSTAKMYVAQLREAGVITYGEGGRITLDETKLGGVHDDG